MAAKWTNWRDGHTPMARCNTCGFECIVSNNPDAFLTDADSCPECVTKGRSMNEHTFQEQIDRLKELEAKATPAPWVWADGLESAYVVGGDGADVLTDGSGNGIWNRVIDGDTPNGQLIIAARNLLPSLLKEREFMLQKNNAYEAGEPILQECIRELNKAVEVAAKEREEMHERIKLLESALTEAYSEILVNANDDALLERIRAALYQKGGKLDGD